MLSLPGLFENKSCQVREYFLSGGPEDTAGQVQSLNTSINVTMRRSQPSSIVPAKGQG
jgi:hypothetical protein